AARLMLRRDGITVVQTTRPVSTHAEAARCMLQMPWENGYVESFNRKLRDELLNRELFATLWKIQVLVERWRRHYNQFPPNRALELRPPAPETIEPQQCA
ncbi:MAG: transposase, partial [Nitrospirota bacterium]